jgi:hypothetical protein
MTALRVPSASVDSLSVVSAGRPLFHRTPAGLKAWPVERPWRLCQVRAVAVYVGSMMGIGWFQIGCCLFERRWNPELDGVYTTGD